MVESARMIQLIQRGIESREVQSGVAECKTDTADQDSFTPELIGTRPFETVPLSRISEYSISDARPTPKIVTSSEEKSNEEVSNEEISNEEVSNDEVLYEEVSNEEVSNEEISTNDTQPPRDPEHGPTTRPLKRTNGKAQSNDAEDGSNSRGHHKLNI